MLKVLGMVSNTNLVLPQLLTTLCSKTTNGLTFQKSSIGSTSCPTISMDHSEVLSILLPGIMLHFIQIQMSQSLHRLSRILTLTQLLISSLMKVFQEKRWMSVSLSTVEASVTFQNKATMDCSLPTEAQLVKEPGSKVLSISGISIRTTSTRTDTPSTSIPLLESHGYTVKPHNAWSVTMTRPPSNSNLNTFNLNNWVELSSGSSPVINIQHSLTRYLKPLEPNNE